MFAPEPPVDDLSTSRGVVLSRAATILRSIETQPLAGGSTGLGGYGGPTTTLSLSHPHGADITAEKGKAQAVLGFRVPPSDTSEKRNMFLLYLREKADSRYSESQQQPNESGFHPSELSTHRSRFSYKSMPKMRADFFSRLPLTALDSIAARPL